MHKLWQMFLSFFKIGLFTLGGGYAMISLIQREVVDKQKWVDEKEFLELLALSQTSPGPIAVNTAVFVGYRQHGIIGSLVTTLGMTLPSFLVILIIAMYLIGFRQNPMVEGIFKGIRPAVVALIAAPLFSLGKAMNLGARGAFMAAVVAGIVALAGFSPILVILISGIGGLLYGIAAQKSEAKQ